MLPFNARKKFIDKGIPAEEIGIFYVTQCAAKIAAIKCPVGEENSPVDGVINMDFIYNKILLSVNQHKNQPQEKVPEQYHLTPQSIQWTLSGGEAMNYPDAAWSLMKFTMCCIIRESRE